MSNNAISIFNARAQDYQDKFMNVDLYADTFDLFCDALPSNAKVLELGCGPGNITRYLLDRCPEFKITGTDLAPNMLTLAKSNNPEAEFSLLDCRAIHTLSTKYDGLMCGFCFPYISPAEARQLIADASQLLTSKGVIYISTMEGAPERCGWEKSSKGDEMYMNYHEVEVLTSALRDYGFTLLDLRRKHYLYNGVDTTDMILIARKC